MRTYRVAVVGVGAVGREMLRCLRNSKIPMSEEPLVLARREREIEVDGVTYKVKRCTPEAFEGVHIALFAGTEGEKGASVTFAPEAIKRGAVVIDNGADFRLKEGVPLVVPEVNKSDLEVVREGQKLIASPNCSTIQMVVAINPLHRRSRVKRIIVTTFQAVSGAGQDAIFELDEQSLLVLHGRQPRLKKAFPYQIAFNLIPQIGSFEEMDYTTEEWKLVRETHKIMHDDTIAITPTTVRVPVFNAHSEVIYVETEEKITAEEARALFSEANAKHFEVLVNLARRAHKAVYGSDDGLLCGIQLTHSGRYSFMKPIIAFHHPILDARAGISDDYPVCTDDYLERLEDEFVKAAKLAMKVGFDFVDIKQCHGYLLCELLSAKSRQGKYGGSFENRTRFIRNTIGKIKSELGERILIATRMSVYDGVPFELDKSTGVGKPSQYPLPYIYGFGCAEDDPMSIDMSEPIKLAELLSSLGVCIINVTMGNPYTNPHIGRPFERPPIDGYEMPEHPLVGVARLLRGAREIQTAVKDVPVVATGLSWLRQFWAHTAVGMITNGYCKLVGLGRMALAYPDFAYDMIKFGTVDENKTCLADSHCTALMRFKHNELCQFPVGCPTRDPLYKPIYHHAVKTLP